jgi:hypothetical protein
MEWHYGIVLHKADKRAVAGKDGWLQSVGEIHTINGIPVCWSETSLSNFVSYQDILNKLRIIVDDLQRFFPLRYPDDFTKESEIETDNFGMSLHGEKE